MALAWSPLILGEGQVIKAITAISPSGFRGSGLRRPLLIHFEQKWQQTPFPPSQSAPSWHLPVPPTNTTSRPIRRSHVHSIFGTYIYGVPGERLYSLHVDGSEKHGSLPQDLLQCVDKGAGLLRH